MSVAQGFNKLLEYADFASGFSAHTVNLPYGFISFLKDRGAHDPHKSSK